MLNFKSPEVTYVESIIVMKKCFRLKDMLYFNVFQPIWTCFGSIFLTWMPKQVFTAIAKFFKKQCFSELPNPLLLDLWNGCCISNVRKKSKASKDGRHYLYIVSQLWWSVEHIKLEGNLREFYLLLPCSIAGWCS